MCQLSDALGRAARGDTNAVAAFYDATVDRAYLLARAVCCDPRLAEIAVRHAYDVAWRAAEVRPGSAGSCRQRPSARSRGAARSLPPPEGRQVRDHPWDWLSR
jgi:hypothetical protein